MRGAYTRPELARKQALRALLDNQVRKEDFVAYDDHLDNAETPYGADVDAHAVLDRGQNVLVSAVSDK